MAISTIFMRSIQTLFACVVFVEVLGPSQPIRVILSMVGLPNHTFLGRLSPLSS